MSYEHSMYISRIRISDYVTQGVTQGRNLKSQVSTITYTNLGRK